MSGISSVGASLQATGSAPNPATPAAASPATGKISPYEAQYLNLQQYDTQELLYASFLSPDAALANTDAVLGQAAQLLAAPGSQSASQTAANAGSTAAVPSVASILAASDQQAAQTLAAYANAPAGSSILDYQA